MAQRPESDDDDFDDIYKEYTGPPVLTVAAVAPEKAKPPNKRSHAGSDDEDETYDPNAVPTDFTSREAKVWEAKSKATERNWKKRKEEEMICKLCGESGHFTQGCPSTLGANRKSQDFIERVAARDKHVRALFTEKVIQKIEKDNGCKFKMEEKFIIVSGKDRLVLAKGVDAVHKVIKEGGTKDSSGSQTIHSRSPERSPVSTRFGRSESLRSVPSPQRSNSQQRYGKQEKLMEDRMSFPSHSESQRSFPSPPRSQSQQRYGKQEKPMADRLSFPGRSESLRSAPSPPKSQSLQKYGKHEKFMEDRISNPSPQRSQSQQRYGKPERPLENRVREDLHKFSRSSSQARGYMNDGARGRSSHSKSPAPSPYLGNSYNSYDDGRSSQSMGVYKTVDRDNERGSDIQYKPDMKYEPDTQYKPDYPALPNTLEELELEYKKEAMDLSRNRDKEEDEENYRHREAIREIRENYMKKLATLRGAHARQWEEFLELDIRRGQQRLKPQTSTPTFSGYIQPIYSSEYDSSSADPNYASAKVPMDSRDRYPQHLMENYPPSRPHDSYADYQRQRQDDYGNSHNRY